MQKAARHAQAGENQEAGTQHAGDNPPGDTAHRTAHLHNRGNAARPDRSPAEIGDQHRNGESRNTQLDF
jgi:hypothetical protein